MASLVSGIGDRGRSIADRARTEGHPYFTSIAITNASSPTGSQGSFILPSLSRALWAETLVVSSNRQMDIQAALGGIYTSVQHVYRAVVGPSQQMIVPIKALIRPTHANAGSTAIGSLNLRNYLDATTTGGYILASLNGYSIYDDTNFGADKVMLVVSDSILNGTAGITAKYNSMEWLTRGYFKTKGSNIRVINKSVSGTTSSDHERFRAHGEYDFPQVDYLHYMLGANDAGQSISAATFQANAAAMIAHKQKLYPNAKMIVWGCTPVENNTTETALALLRTAGQAAVTAANDPKVLYCSLGAAFDRTQGTTVYATTDSAGSRIHPNDTGHAAAYTVISAFLDANSVTI